MNQFFNPPEGSVQLMPKQTNIYLWGWQVEARFRDAVCGQRFGKTFLAKAEMRRAARLAAKWNVWGTALGSFRVIHIQLDPAGTIWKCHLKKI